MMGMPEAGMEGVIPRLCADLFKRIQSANSSDGTTYSVEVSYLEIYNEKVRSHPRPRPAYPLALARSALGLTLLNPHSKHTAT
jgi:hypothetical protein